jgi:phenylalanyl-tRNA synthetase alpha chain
MPRNTETDHATVAAVDPQALEKDALAALADAASPDDVEQVRVEYLGRKSELKLALRDVRDRETGMALNQLRERIESAVAAREEALQRAELEQLYASSAVDVTLPGEPTPRGRLHLLTQIQREIEDIFLGLGYEVVHGDEVTTVWHNFDALTQPPTHPSRSKLETFYFDDETLLRTHTSPDQIRVMESRQPPIYMISPGRCYRRDTPDATHSPTFLQVECLAVDRGITLAHLQGTVLAFSRQLFGPDREVRMRTSYFPFTEPSVEFDVTCFLCDGAGCPVCKHSGWIEMGGAGVVDPDVFRHVGYDAEIWSGFAFGFGIERIAMLRHGLPDLRAFWENDLRVLSQF